MLGRNHRHSHQVSDQFKTPSSSEYTVLFMILPTKISSDNNDFFLTWMLVLFIIYDYVHGKYRPIRGLPFALELLTEPNSHLLRLPKFRRKPRKKTTNEEAGGGAGGFDTSYSPQLALKAHPVIGWWRSTNCENVPNSWRRAVVFIFKAITTRIKISQHLAQRSWVFFF